MEILHQFEIQRVRPPGETLRVPAVAFATPVETGMVQNDAKTYDGAA